MQQSNPFQLDSVQQGLVSQRILDLLRLSQEPQVDLAKA